MFTCLHMLTYLRAYICSYVYMLTYINMFTCLHMYTYFHAYICSHAYVFAYAHVFTCLHMVMCVNRFASWEDRWIFNSVRAKLYSFILFLNRSSVNLVGKVGSGARTDGWLCVNHYHRVSEPVTPLTFMRQSLAGLILSVGVTSFRKMYGRIDSKILNKSVT